MTPEVPDRDEWFSEELGFPRPDWRAISGWMQAHVRQADLHASWQQAARHWLMRLRNGLGGKYAMAESTHFHLLSELDPRQQEEHLKFLEKTRIRLLATLGDVAWSPGTGKHVVLRFTEQDDYFAYLSYFFPDGNYATSSGVLLPRGYVHIAYPAMAATYEQATLAHEFAHNLLCHLPLPRWLGELLAMLFEAEIANSGAPAMDGELAGRHHAFWNAQRIQQFWRGELFYTEEGQALSYSLSRVLQVLILTDLRPSPEQFRRFVLRADRNDAGAIAVQEELGIDLGDLVGRFLGPGDWAPAVPLWPAKNTSKSG